jgi:quercetin dioxygenase-like cupin family protein/heme-degrading monooxygenase HmoA
MNPIVAQSPIILHLQDLPAIKRGGVTTVPLMTHDRGATSFLNGITTFKAGAAMKRHTHNVTESVIVLQGTAAVDIDGTRTELQAHDTALIPANVPHHFENASSAEVLKLLWTYASVEATSTITSSGAHSRVDSMDPSGEQTPGTAVHEFARIVVVPGKEAEFEAAVESAIPLFQRARGARTLTLERAVENPLEYKLIVGWESLDDHIAGFKNSPEFMEWRRLITDKIARLPEVTHFRNALTAF